MSREVFAKVCRLLYERHLVTGVGGNLCMRAEEGFLLTPSGWSLRDVTPESVVAVDREGRAQGDLRPSKESTMHLAILNARPDLNVVCHVHGVYIVAASAMVEPGETSLPPLCPGFCHFAYPLPMLPFMVPGSPQLAERVGQSMAQPGRCAVLLQNHGLIAAGEDWQTAVNVAEEVDEAASIFVLTHAQARPISESEAGKIT